MNVSCTYCKRSAELVTGANLYPRFKSLASRYFWRCTPCGAHVGCHPGTKNPLGSLANEELRKARQQAHSSFDSLWQSVVSQEVPKHLARTRGYAWLFEQLNLSKEDCHIGMFDVDMCRRVVEVCKPYA